MKTLLSGNEAVARGAWEAGTVLATAYPGTPSTEILETIARTPEIQVQWAPNEKVAYEVAAGASMGGVRALSAMKHVGVNVAADPLFSSSYSGANGGLVIVSADDPAMHSSQNEQDNRNLARAAKIPVLEPSNSQEALDFVRIGFELSEAYETPVMLRLTTRVCHSVSPVDVDSEATYRGRGVGYEPDPGRNVLIPANARRRRLAIEERMTALETAGCGMPEVNRIEWEDRTIGVITSGVSYEYVREVLPHASVLKIGLSNPLPRHLVREFAAGVDELYVVEELDPVLEEQVRALGVRCVGKEIIPSIGELGPAAIAEAFGIPTATGTQPVSRPLPPRPPVLCAGCSHRGVFYTLSRMGLIVTGDIGCYSLGMLPPLGGMDSCLCMGASVGMATGMEVALRAQGDDRRVVGVIGDSTFVHSGITGLINAVYNGSASTLLILDNGTTAMTGHQDHPGTGITASGEVSAPLDFVGLCRSIGVSRVREVDPYRLDALEDALYEELDADEPSVIICRSVCRLIDRARLGESVEIEVECGGCGTCLELGCPAIDEIGGSIRVNTAVCEGCGLCVQVCPFGIVQQQDEQHAVSAC